MRTEYIVLNQTTQEAFFCKGMAEVSKAISCAYITVVRKTEENKMFTHKDWIVCEAIMFSETLPKKKWKGNEKNFKCVKKSNSNTYYDDF